jgi:hypothetical protein
MPKADKPKHIKGQHNHHHHDVPSDLPFPNLPLPPPTDTTPSSLDTERVSLQVNDEQGKLLYLKNPELFTFNNKYYSSTKQFDTLTVNSNETPIVKSGGCRTEFRELNRDGTNAAWNSNDSHILKVELSIDQLPLPNKTISFAQIKTDKEECQLVLQDKTIYLRQFDVAHHTLKTDYELGNKFSFTLSFIKDRCVVELSTGETFNFTDHKEGCYFKFGNYQQPNLTTKIDKGQESIVKIYSFSIN